jgi:NAD(P)H dehydrogenase (quinone)
MTMVKRKILILLGSEDKETTAGMFAEAYERGARARGHDVHRINIGDLRFDPLLHKGYKVIQELEPDLKKFQEEVRWSEHLVVIYPNWWSTMPAILKGLFDRAWLPGFAFHFRKDKAYLWDKLLKGRSARVMITMNAAPWLERIAIGDYTNEIRNGILKFAGFSPVRLSTFGPVERATDSQRQAWLKKVEQTGRDGD